MARRKANNGDPVHVRFSSLYMAATFYGIVVGYDDREYMVKFVARDGSIPTYQIVDRDYVFRCRTHEITKIDAIPASALLSTRDTLISRIRRSIPTPEFRFPVGWVHEKVRKAQLQLRAYATAASHTDICLPTADEKLRIGPRVVGRMTHAFEL